MREEDAIEVSEIQKTFKVYLDKSNLLKERVLFWKRNRYETRQVLKGISFSVRKGEAIGLVGHNGCGKSTTLKLLTKIMYPDSGTVEMRGRVSALIELGAGFHPDMSGRENIYTNAAIFGLTRKEIDQKVADIIAFSELENFIDNPVRTYSSGMYMRLAFAVAINVDADILLIDEILAVGDAAFQTKCFERLKAIKRHGTTIVIVSHSLDQIEKICERSIWIDGGEIRAEGSPKNIHTEYLEHMGVRKSEDKEKDIEAFRNLDAATVSFGAIGWGDENGVHILNERTGSIVVEPMKDNPSALALYIESRADSGSLEISVEGASALKIHILTTGEKVLTFPLSGDRYAGSRIRIDFAVDESTRGKIAVKGVNFLMRGGA